MPDTMRIENNDATDIYNFLDSSNLRVEEETQYWQRSGDNLVTQTMTLVKKGSASDIRTEVAELETVLEAAVKWHRDKRRNDPYWWRWVTSGESEKRSLIFGYELLPFVKQQVIRPDLDNSAGAYQLALTRHRAYEDVSPLTHSVAGLTISGGIWNISGTIAAGLLDGRIGKFTFENTATGGFSEEVDQLWVGIRPLRNGVSTFDPIFEAEDSPGKTGTAEANTSGGEYVSLTLSGTNTQLLGWSLDNGARDWEDHVGTYVVLMRYRYSDTSTLAGVSASITVGGLKAVNQEQYPPQTSAWHIHPLGEIEIPSFRVGSDIYSSLSLHPELAINGRSIEGSGDLHVDKLTLIPAEHFFNAGSNVELGEDAINSASNARFVAYTHPDDEVDAFTYDTTSNQLTTRPPMQPSNWAYPAEGGVLVMEYDITRLTTINVHNVSRAANLTIEVYPRWLTYRT